MFAMMWLNDAGPSSRQGQGSLRGGDTARRLVDCLIAVVAMGAGAEGLHHDADFISGATSEISRTGSMPFRWPLLAFLHGRVLT